MGLPKALGWMVAIGLGGALIADMAGQDPVTVEKIVDGDTIDVRLDGETTRIRLLNVDTPEIGRDGAPSECLAEDARDYLATVLPIGTEVDLEFDEERLDKYGRTLAGVLKDGSLVNADIAREGLGHAVDIAPNHRFYPDVAEAEREAARAQRGLSALGPECFVAKQDAEAITQAKQAQQEAEHVFSLLPHLDDEENFSEARRTVTRIAAARAALSQVRNAGERQSEFQKHAYGEQYRGEVDALDDTLQRAEADIGGAVALEASRREAEKRAEEQRRRDEAEAADRVAPVLGQQLAPAPGQQEVPSSAAQPVPVPQTGGGSDNYTGCRAYGGNYAFTSVDDKGRRYAKIDCTTKAQIG